MIVEGTVLAGSDYRPVEGRVVVEEGEITAVEEAPVDSTDIVLPAFVNAHTHIGDSIAKEAGAGLTLDELVAPPDGLKHRLLRDADRQDLIAAMRRTVRFMRATGTAAFIDFREGGVPGVTALQEAVSGSSVEAVILGRETEDVLDTADGFGASSARDGQYEAARRATREAGGIFGIHAGERDSGDINGAFDLDPDFLVHMVHPDPVHLDRLADRETPVVVCPRSNLVTDAGIPDVNALRERTSVALGTDNVMLDNPSLFRELEFLSKVCDVPAPAALRMATRAGAAIAGRDAGILEPGRPGKILVLDGDSDNLAGAQDPVRAVVRRAGTADVKAVHL